MKYRFVIHCAAIFWLMFCSTHLSAQDSQNDYIILLSGQKVSGKVIRDFDYSHYSSITFIGPEAGKQTFTPEEIQGFGLSNGRLFYTRNLPEIEGKVFARQILSGALSLIGYKERIFVEGENGVYELKAGYEIVEKEAINLKVFKKPYLGTLGLLIAGVCGSQLTGKLNRTLFSEQSFIDLLSKYHDCEGIDYTVHVERIKLVRVSPYLGGGFMTVQTIANNRTAGRKDVLEQSGFPYILAGLKVYQFRNLPKLGLDVGLGYVASENQINSEYIHPDVTLTGTEDFKLKSIIVPVFLNYSVISSRTTETYIGVGAFYNRNQLQSSEAFRDLTTNYNAATTLEEKPYMKWSKNTVNPSVKVGTHFNADKSLGFLLEFQVAYTPSAFTADLSFNKAVYNQITSSFLFAIRY